MIFVKSRVALIVIALSASSSAWSDIDFRGGWPPLRALDLSTIAYLPSLNYGDPVPHSGLLEESAGAILAKPNLGRDAPGQVGWFEFDDRRARQAEGVRIAAETPNVARKGKRLTIKMQPNGRVSFTDWDDPGTPNADGDHQTYIYGGRLGALRYHQVEWRSQHDSPSSYLVNPDNGQTVLVHNSEDAVKLWPDGKSVLIVDSSNFPFLIAVASLDESGPQLVFMCRARDSSQVTFASFKGWSDDHSFEVVLSTGEHDVGEAIPMRVTHNGQAWHIATQDPHAIDRIGYGCRQKRAIDAVHKTVERVRRSGSSS